MQAVILLILRRPLFIPVTSKKGIVKTKASPHFYRSGIFDLN